MDVYTVSMCSLESSLFSMSMMFYVRGHLLNVHLLLILSMIFFMSLSMSLSQVKVRGFRIVEISAVTRSCCCNLCRGRDCWGTHRGWGRAGSFGSTGDISSSMGSMATVAARLELLLRSGRCGRTQHRQGTETSWNIEMWFLETVHNVHISLSNLDFWSFNLMTSLT